MHEAVPGERPWRFRKYFWQRGLSFISILQPAELLRELCQGGAERQKVDKNHFIQERGLWGRQGLRQEHQVDWEARVQARYGSRQDNRDERQNERSHEEHGPDQRQNFRLRCRWALPTIKRGLRVSKASQCLDVLARSNRSRILGQGRCHSAPKQKLWAQNYGGEAWELKNKLRKVW